jgi:thioredoxin-related protein
MTRRSALKNTQSYLSLLKNETFKRIKSGESREETISNVKLLSFGEDKFYKTWHHRNVGRAYDELKVFWEKNNEVSFKIVEELKKLEMESTNSLNKSKVKIVTVIEPKPKKLPEKNIIVKKKIAYPSSKVKYKSFTQAINLAKTKNKIVLIKVRSTICKYCDQLDRVMAKNSKVKKILNKYFELVKVNTDYENIPMDLTVRSTPTLIFIRPDNKKVLMKLAGIRALGELLEILNEAVDDGHNAGYLKP